MKLGTCAGSWRNGNDMRDEDKDKSSMESREQALESQACLEGRPIAIARLVRSQSSAEIAFAVVDDYQRRGIGSALVSELFARARTAGITEVTALVSSNNTAALALIRRLTRILTIQYEGSDLSIRASIS
jgi:ribosomal protein S18 acetylase RimI-like enzyme